MTRRFVIDRATINDNEALCALCKIPLKGNISLAFERSPDFFSGSSIQCEEGETYACREKRDGVIVGVFSVGKRKVFVQGEVKLVPYLSDLRIHPAVQGSGLLYQVTRYVSAHVDLQHNLAQAIVFADNKNMLSLIGRLQQFAERKSLVNFYDAGNYISYMVKFRKPGNTFRSAYSIIKAQPMHVPQMQAFIMAEGPHKNFYPYYNFDQLGTPYHQGLSLNNFYLAFDREQLIGIAGVWDQHSIKKTRVVEYALLYKLTRPFINLFGWLNGGFTLPAKGDVLHYVTVHSILTRNNDPSIFQSLLRQIHNDSYHLPSGYFLVGLDEKDPLNNALHSFKHRRIIRGKHFLVSKKENFKKELLASLYYLEAARI